MEAAYEAAINWKPYPKYKASGVEWLGEVPEYWDTSKVKFSAFVKGRVGWQGLNSNEFIDNGPYLVTGTDFTDGKINWKSCYHVSEERYNQDPFIKLRENDLLITKDGTIGKVAIVEHLDGEATLNSGIFVIRSLNNSYNIRFMFWILNSTIFNSFIDYIKTGSTINHLYQDAFTNFVFPIPIHPEQRAIAAFLDHKTAKIDALINKKERLIELLQEKRAALISHAVTRGLDPSVPMKDSGEVWIGEIPAHWEVMQLRFIFTFLNSRRVPLSSEERGKMARKYPYYGASGIIDYVEDYIFDEPLILVAEDGANLFSRSTPLAFIASGKYWVNNHAHILSPIEGMIEYWSHLLAIIIYDPWITGSAQPKLTKDNLGSIHLPVPPKPEREYIIKFLSEELLKFDSLITKIRLSIETLKDYRVALISAAVTGKIDVRNEVGGVA